MTTRVRFAPSPTGFLHIGGARTALFNWLYARAQGGKFLLRIEDTDRERSEQRFTDDIMESLRWLGMEPDEEPIFQSKRFDRYKTLVDQLMKEKKVYRCDCTPEALDVVRKQCEAEKRAFRYPGTCREKTTVDAKHVYRLRIPSSGEIGFDDQIRERIQFQAKDFDDWVIARSDGSPTYNFAVVIDDHDQGITHVLRGDDHINNTPKQLFLYQALGWEPPKYAHLPMILGTDRTKLSKRHGAASTIEYRKMGYLPEAIINFLVRLGWSHGDQEILPVEELKKVFSLEKIGKANAVFNPEKLTWLSGHYFRESPASVLYDYLTMYFVDETKFLKSADRGRVEKGIQITQGKVKTCLELIDQLQCLFGPNPAYDLNSLKAEERPKVAGYLAGLLPSLESTTFDHDGLDRVFRAEAEKLGIKLGPLAQAGRFAVTGGKISPGLFEMLEVQGKETVLRRLRAAIAALG